MRLGATRASPDFTMALARLRMVPTSVAMAARLERMDQASHVSPHHTVRTEVVQQGRNGGTRAVAPSRAQASFQSDGRRDCMRMYLPQAKNATVMALVNFAQRVDEASAVCKWKSR